MNRRGTFWPHESEDICPAERTAMNSQLQGPLPSFRNLLYSIGEPSAPFMPSSTYAIPLNQQGPQLSGGIPSLPSHAQSQLPSQFAPQLAPARELPFFRRDMSCTGIPVADYHGMQSDVANHGQRSNSALKASSSAKHVRVERLLVSPSRAGELFANNVTEVECEPQNEENIAPIMDVPIQTSNPSGERQDPAPQNSAQQPSSAQTLNNADLDNLIVGSIHEGRRHFTCALCVKSFKLKGHVKQHIKTVHRRDRRFPCTVPGCTVRLITRFARDQVCKSTSSLFCSELMSLDVIAILTIVLTPYLFQFSPMTIHNRSEACLECS